MPDEDMTSSWRKTTATGPETVRWEKKAEPEDVDKAMQEF